MRPFYQVLEEMGMMLAIRFCVISVVLVVSLFYVFVFYFGKKGS